MYQCSQKCGVYIKWTLVVIFGLFIMAFMCTAVDHDRKLANSIGAQMPGIQTPLTFEDTILAESLTPAYLSWRPPEIPEEIVSPEGFMQFTLLRQDKPAGAEISKVHLEEFLWVTGSLPKLTPDGLIRLLSCEKRSKWAHEPPARSISALQQALETTAGHEIIHVLTDPSCILFGGQIQDIDAHLFRACVLTLAVDRGHDRELLQLVLIMILNPDSAQLLDD